MRVIISIIKLVTITIKSWHRKDITCKLYIISISHFKLKTLISFLKMIYLMNIILIIVKILDIMKYHMNNIILIIIIMKVIIILLKCLVIGILQKNMLYQEGQQKKRRRIQLKLYKVNKNNEITVQTCPCCGFEVDREDIPYCSDPMALSFLGSGFTLFYNYLKFCIIILFI